MQDYQDACRVFSMAKLERGVLQGSLADGLNAAVECSDRWADNGRVALRWISTDFAEKTVTFRSLRDLSAQFANLLLEAKEWIRARGTHFDHTEQAHVIKARLAELQADRRNLFRNVGQQVFQGGRKALGIDVGGQPVQRLAT